MNFPTGGKCKLDKWGNDEGEDEFKYLIYIITLLCESGFSQCFFFLLVGRYLPAIRIVYYVILYIFWKYKILKNYNWKIGIFSKNLIQNIVRSKNILIKILSTYYSDFFILKKKHWF